MMRRLRRRVRFAGAGSTWNLHASIGFALAFIVTLVGLASPGVAFIDDFEDGNFSEWVVKCGAWQIVDGFGGGRAIASTEFDNVLMHSTLSAAYGHYHYDLYLPADSRADGDLLFQIVGTDLYWVLLGPDNSDNVVDRIIRASNGGFASQAAIGCAPFHLTRETWHRIDVYRFPNGVIQVFTDNEATSRMEAYDTSIASAGGIAIRTAVQGVRFDNVSFDEALPPNPIPPASSNCPSWGGLLAECSLSSLPQCADGVDNDQDGCIDYPSDTGCSSPQDDSEAEAGCGGGGGGDIRETLPPFRGGKGRHTPAAFPALWGNVKQIYR